MHLPDKQNFIVWLFINIFFNIFDSVEIMWLEHEIAPCQAMKDQRSSLLITNNLLPVR